MTAKQLEQETGCKIMVRGKGSMRDKKKVSTVHCNILNGFRIPNWNGTGNEPERIAHSIDF